MLTIESDALQIEGFDTKGRQALTLYLDTHPSRGAGRNVRAQIERLLRPTRASLDGDAEGTQLLERAADLAMARIASLDAAPRAIAAFVCPELGFLRIVSLPEPVEPMAHWGTELQLRPFVAALDEHERT